MQFRQGDVLLEKIDDLPILDQKKYSAVEGEEIKDTIVLAHGEATGHKHAIKIKNGNAVLVKAVNENKFFLMIIKQSELVHEEHSKINLPIGNYEVIRQREYTPQSFRMVAD